MEKILISHIIAGIFTVSLIEATLYVGDPCLIRNKAGICTHQDNCPELKKAFYEGNIHNDEIPRCGFSIHKEIICCPIENIAQNTNFQRRTLGRPALEHCNRIEHNVQPVLTEHIIGGLPVSMGEYPFMAAIGYRRLDDAQEPYEYNCAGSLIASRFVLTAAHCVTDPRRQPELVLLGAISLPASNEGTRINVKKIYPHPQYMPSGSYHDIALIELESEVEFSNDIYPLCLHSNDTDLPPNTELYVSGWGQTEKKRHSDVLLTAKVNLVTLEDCNKEVSTLGFWRRLSQGVQNTQICAQDTEKDACSGDSGGPLILIKNKDLGRFNVVGITTAGFNCGGRIPSFYTRVSAYLNFIEDIVWPNMSGI